MSAGEIGADDGVPVVGLHAHGEAVASDGGIVDENIEAAEFFGDLLEPGFDLLGVGYVHFYSEGLTARGGDFADEQGELFFGAGADGNFCAGNDEGLRGVPADA